MRFSVFPPRAVFAFAFVASPLFPAFCEPELSCNVLAAYYPAHHWGYEASGFAPPDFTEAGGGTGERVVGSAWGAAEAKASLSLTDRLPFLVGAGPLFSGNNLEFKGTAELSPVSINLVGRAAIQPIAFLVFEAGGSVGTGWTALSFRGLAINPEGSLAADDLDLTPFGGAVWRVWGGGTFQFDLAAVRPGDWNHLIFLATGKVEYKAYTGASAGEAWLWEADQADNFNGAKFLGTYVLAYRMPERVDLVGLIAESEEWLGGVRDYSPMSDSGGWGSDFRTWRVGALANAAFGKRDSLAVLCQFKLRPDWTDATTLRRDFRERDWDGSYWYFDRIAVSYTHVFLPRGAGR